MRGRARPALVGAALALLTVAGCSSGEQGQQGQQGQQAGSPPDGPAPELAVEVVTDELEHGWDVGFLPDGQLLVTERPARITLLSSGREGATVTRVDADLSDVAVGGEGGLLGMVVHPDFAESREFTTCLNHAEGGRPVDIRLVTWRLAQDGRSATRERELLTGLPVADGGRHSGCRPAIGPDGELLVGTGDTADPDVSQDLTSLGGKVLRLDLETGAPWPSNPWIDSDDPRQQYVLSYGHRNLQGIAVQPGTGEIYTAEHGPDVNDEVNRIEAGANYGWDPSQGGAVDSYDESVPMTDTDRFPDAVPAVWRSGEVTQAICSATFLVGEQWGELEGDLVVTALKGATLLVLEVAEDGSIASTTVPEATDGSFGRLRASRIGPDGGLYVSTSNGEDDQLLRLTPAGQA